MKRLTPLATAVGCLTLAAAPASADTAAFDKQLAPIVAQYGKIHHALSADNTTGVAAAAAQIARASKTLRPEAVQGKHAKHYQSLPKKITTAATKLAKAKGIAAARKAFMELSRPLAMWASMSKPPGISVVYCSMAKGSWLQTDTKLRNPYYGAKMLRCGEIVGGKGAGKAGGHMKH